MAVSDPERGSDSAIAAFSAIATSVVVVEATEVEVVEAIVVVGATVVVAATVVVGVTTASSTKSFVVVRFAETTEAFDTDPYTTVYACGYRFVNV